MGPLIDNIFSFFVRQGKTLFLLVSILITLEGLLYIFFPEKIKEIIKNAPLRLFRSLGILVLGIGIILIMLYSRILIRF